MALKAILFCAAVVSGEKYCFDPIPFDGQLAESTCEAARTAAREAGYESRCSKPMTQLQEQLQQFIAETEKRSGKWNADG